jgi:dihydrofolate synthase/folylpolyglutamate synthase
MTAAILERSGARVGLYTSPHVESVRERIMVDRQWIPEERLVTSVNRMHTYLQESLRSSATYTPTFFEIFTAAAFLDFIAERVDYAVFEVGLGGRLDATNVTLPVVCGITPVSFDHTDKLGDTLDRIGWEKAGILKPRVPVVVGPQEPEALEGIRIRTRPLETPVRMIGRDIVLDGDAVVTPRRRYTGLRVPLAGAHQWANAAMAVALAEEAMCSRGLRLEPQVVREGLASVSWRARIEQVAENPTVIVDAAHNRASIRVLLDTLAERHPNPRTVFVVGVSSDKDVDGILGELIPRAAGLVFSRSESPRACPPATLLGRARALGATDAVACDDPAQAVALARERATEDGLVCVTGSFYLAGEVITALAPTAT